MTRHPRFRELTLDTASARTYFVPTCMTHDRANGRLGLYPRKRGNPATALEQFLGGTVGGAHLLEGFPFHEFDILALERLIGGLSGG